MEVCWHCLARVGLQLTLGGLGPDKLRIICSHLWCIRRDASPVAVQGVPAEHMLQPKALLSHGEQPLVISHLLLYHARLLTLLRKSVLTEVPKISILSACTAEPDLSNQNLNNTTPLATDTRCSDKYKSL